MSRSPVRVKRYESASVRGEMSAAGDKEIFLLWHIMQHNYVFSPWTDLQNVPSRFAKCSLPSQAFWLCDLVAQDQNDKHTTAESEQLLKVKKAGFGVLTLSPFS